MTDYTKTPKTIEELETEIVGLKIKVRRIEDFLTDMPIAQEYLLHDPMQAEDDELVDKAIEIVRQYDAASASLLQRRLEIGYARAARLLDILEARKVIEPSDGTSKPRKVLQKEEDKSDI